jgi:hypothetical protein
VNGARWVQHSLLDAHPEAGLRVYAVWFSMYPTDTRDRWPNDVLTDGRVVHWWDEGKVVGRWYARHLRLQTDRSPGSIGTILWDAYLVYGPEARWTDVPTGLRRWGRTILQTRDRLRETVGALVNVEAGGR